VTVREKRKKKKERKKGKEKSARAHAIHADNSSDDIHFLLPRYRLIDRVTRQGINL